MRKHLSRKIRALIFSGLSFAFWETNGQEIDSVTQTLNLDAITVNALSIPATKFNLPGAVSSISPAQLKVSDQSIVTSELNSLPGVFMQSGALNTNRITIRGVGSRSPFATNKIRAFYGLIPLTDGGGETTIEDLDMSLIGSIEVQKGPNASLYGAGLGGVILLNPAFPANQVFLRVGAGSFGLRRLGMGASIKNESGQLTFGVSTQSADGYRENNEVKRENFFLRWKKEKERSDLGFLVIHTNQKAFIPSSLGSSYYEQAPEIAAFTWASSEGYEDYGKTLVGMEYDLNVNEQASFNASVYVTSRKNYEPRPFNILEDRVLGQGMRAQFLYSPGKFKLSSVLELYTDRYEFNTYENRYQENPGGGSIRGVRLDSNDEVRSFINYAAAMRVPILDRLTLETGFNLNKTNYLFNEGIEKKAFDLIFSPRLSLIHQVTDEVNFYGTLSHGFSPPSVEETLNEQGGFNVDIQAETGWNREIGVKGNHGWINYSIAAYSMDIRNMLLTRRTAEDLTFGLNGGSARHDGLELQSEVLIFSEGKNQILARNAFSLNRYTFKNFVNDGSDYSGNRLTGVPLHQLSVGLDFTSEWIFAGARYQYVARMPITDDNLIFSEDYKLMNAYLGTQISFANWEVRSTLRINNLLDEKYASMFNINAQAFGSGEPRYYYPGLPRNMQLNIELIYEL